MNILELQNVSYQYDKNGKKVLSAINLSFESGTLYVLMGKSGSGKTTLLSLLAGLDIPIEGKILFNGNDLKNLDRDNYRAREIGVIFQAYNLLTNATALENILLSMEISGNRARNKKQIGIELLRKVGIDSEKINCKILKFSGGEQQRIGIARALSHNPDIILADEPTGNLDEQTEDEIMKIFRSLAKEQNKCVIIVSHSRNVAKYADELIQLNKIQSRGAR